MVKVWIRVVFCIAMVRMVRDCMHRIEALHGFIGVQAYNRIAIGTEYENNGYEKIETAPVML